MYGRTILRRTATTRCFILPRLQSEKPCRPIIWFAAKSSEQNPGDMAPRRSPRLKGPSPKPELPLKPLPPKRVNDVAADSVRAANYKVELAAWEAAKLEHTKLMKTQQKHINIYK